MSSYRSLAVAIAPIALAIAAVACNGQVSTPDESGSTSSRSQKGDSEQGRDGTKSASSTTQKSPPQGIAAAEEPACDYDHGSSSGGGDGTSYSCESIDHYSCGGSTREIRCSNAAVNGEWGRGSCTCDGTTFTLDKEGCSPGAEDYAKCNLPLPEGWGSGAGGSTTSSSGSLGSSGSSGFGGGSTTSSSSGG